MGGQQKDFISDIVFFQHQDGMRLKVRRHFLQCIHLSFNRSAGGASLCLSARNQVVSLPQSSFEPCRSSLLTVGGGRGVVEEPNHTTASLALYNSFNSLCLFYPFLLYVSSWICQPFWVCMLARLFIYLLPISLELCHFSFPLQQFHKKLYFILLNVAQRANY